MKTSYTMILVAITFGFFTARSESYVWQGPATGGDWNASGNWSPNGVPTGGDTATFKETTTIDSGISLGSDASKSLTIVVQPDSGVAAQTVKLTGVISGAGGLVAQPMQVTNKHILYLSNEASTFTGPVLADGTGMFKVERIYNQGQVCSLGKGSVVTLNNSELQFRVNNICFSNRRFVLTAYRQFEVESGKQFNLTGELETTKVYARWLGEWIINPKLTSSVTQVQRTDDGTVTILNDENEFSVVPGCFRGSMKFNSVADSGVASSAGTANSFILGSASDASHAGLYFNKSNNRDSTTHRWIIIDCAEGANRTLGNLGADTTLTIAADVKINQLKNVTFNIQADGDMVLNPGLMGNHKYTTIHKKGLGECTQHGNLWSHERPVYVEAGRMNFMSETGRVEPIHVSSGAVLGGTGHIEFCADIAAGGAIAAGTSKTIGRLGFYKGGSATPRIDLADGAEIHVKVNPSTGECDVINSASRPVNVAGRVVVRISTLDGSKVPPGKYTFLNFGTLNGATAGSFTVVSNPRISNKSQVVIGEGTLTAWVIHDGLNISIR